MEIPNGRHRRHFILRRRMKALRCLLPWRGRGATHRAKKGSLHRHQTKKNGRPHVPIVFTMETIKGTKIKAKY